MLERYFVFEQPKARAVMKIQSEIMHLVREYLREEGFMEIRPPIFEPFTDPGIRGAEFFKVDFYGRPYTLMSALTVHKPVLATHLGRIYSFCPCARKEPASMRTTGRHLSEFYQIEVEIPGVDYRKAMQIAEALLKHVVSGIVRTCKKELDVLGRELKTFEHDFKCLTHKEVTELAVSLGFQTKASGELSWEAEKAISLQFKHPFFVTEYPKGSRGFYDKDGEDALLDFDLIYPEGFGEAASGSEREFDYDKILGKLRKDGHEKDFGLYLDIVKRGVKPTAGFGIGLERLTRYICGLESIEHAAPFSKLPG